MISILVWFITVGENITNKNHNAFSTLKPTGNGETFASSHPPDALPYYPPIRAANAESFSTYDGRGHGHQHDTGGTTSIIQTSDGRLLLVQMIGETPNADNCGNANYSQAQVQSPTMLVPTPLNISTRQM